MKNSNNYIEGTYEKMLKTAPETAQRLARVKKQWCNFGEINLYDDSWFGRKKVLDK